MTAENAADHPEKANQAVESVRENPEASLIDKAIAHAVSLQQQGKRDDAIEKWRTIARIVEGSDNDLAARACFSAGYLMILAESPNDAIADFNQAIRLKSDYAKAYYNRGAAKAVLRRYNDAIADYDAAIILKPDDAGAYSSRGVLKAAVGLKDEARKDFEAALDLARNANDATLAAQMEKSLRDLDADNNP